jgi:RNA polymerase sigma factor (sigma-70 family)
MEKVMPRRFAYRGVALPSGGSPRDVPTDVGLLERLRNVEDQESWREFHRLYAVLIYSRAMKSGLTDAEAKDVVQETMLQAVRSLPTFRYQPERSSFRDWLFNLADWRVRNQIRRRMPKYEQIGPGEESVELRHWRDFQVPGEEQIYKWADEEWAMALVSAAVRTVQGRVKSLQFYAFQLRALEGLAGKKAAELAGLSVPMVYLATSRVKQMIKKEFYSLKKKHEGTA